MNLEVNKAYTIGDSPESFSVKVLDILNDGISSHKLQYLEETETKPVTPSTDKDYFHFPGIYLSHFKITEIK